MTPHSSEFITNRILHTPIRFSHSSRPIFTLHRIMAEEHVLVYEPPPRDASSNIPVFLFESGIPRVEYPSVSIRRNGDPTSSSSHTNTVRQSLSFVFSLIASGRGKEPGRLLVFCRKGSESIGGENRPSFRSQLLLPRVYGFDFSITQLSKRN